MGTARLQTDPDGKQHEVTVDGQVLTAPRGLPQRGRPGDPPADRWSRLGHGDDRGRAAGPRRATGAPGHRGRRLHRLRVRPDVPPLRRRGHHHRRRRDRRRARTTTCSRSSPTPFVEEGVTIVPGRPTQVSAARRRHRGHGGRRQHRDSAATCSWPPAGGPTLTCSATTASRPTSTASSSSTAGSPPRSPASGRWATSTGTEHSPTPPTRTRRSCSTRRVRSTAGCPRTPCSPTRRWAGWA